MKTSINAAMAFGAMLGVGLVAALPRESHAQTVPAELEGPIGFVADDGDGSGSITVMGILVDIPAGTLIHSPTANLTIEQLADPAELPGRSRPGFEGGTAIIIGNSTGGVVTATDVFVEPAENVVLGEITTNTPLAEGCAISLQGVELVFLGDPRIPFGQAVNGGGFEIDWCTVPVAAAASAEGYYGEDGRLYIFAFESDGGEAADPGNQVTVTRAQCRADKDELRAQGSSTQADGNVTIFDNETDVLLGTAAVAADPVGGGGAYSFRGNVPVCPNEIRVVHDNGAFVVASVDLR